MRLRGKILLYSSALVVALIVAMVVYVDRQAERFVTAGITRDLAGGRQRIQAADADRTTGVLQTARLVASFPKLKSMLATDSATIRDFLISYQQENRRSELLIVLDNTGSVLARTDTADNTPLPDARKRWVEPAMAGNFRGATLASGNAVFKAVAVPADAGGAVFGFVIAGAPLDDRYAALLSQASLDEVVILSDSVLGSTLPRTGLPLQRSENWLRQAGAAAPDRSTLLKVGEENYLATTAINDAGYTVVALKSRDRALEPYRNIQFGLLVLGVAAALAGVLASAFLARTVTYPVSKLLEGTEQVAAGRLDFQLDVRSSDEVGDLARGFNSMVQGLRERANMQKFVSRSTLEMIQASLEHDVSAGKRIEATIFFSDMRDFSSMSERRPPEEVVQILNRCLSIQADLIKKFQGDVDKYVGDAVVAVFSGEQMVLNAVRCAAEIQKRMGDWNTGTPPGERRLEIGIAIVTGEVILGSVGSADRQDFTVIGSNVNLCARLCSKARGGEILLSESAWERVKQSVKATRLESVMVKGFTDPVPVYQLAAGD